MRRRKLIVRRSTIRHLTSAEHAIVAGGNTQGAACDNSVAKTQCDLAGCALVCTADSCDGCWSVAYTLCNTCTA